MRPGPKLLRRTFAVGVGNDLPGAGKDQGNYRCTIYYGNVIIRRITGSAQLKKKSPAPDLPPNVYEEEKG